MAAEREEKMMLEMLLRGDWPGLVLEQMCRLAEREKDSDNLKSNLRLEKMGCCYMGERLRVIFECLMGRAVQCLEGRGMQI